MDFDIHGRDSQRPPSSELLHPGCSQQRLLMETGLLLEQGMSRKCHGVTWSLAALERCHVHAHLVLGEGGGAGDAREGLRQRGVGAAGTQHQPR